MKAEVEMISQQERDKQDSVGQGKWGGEMKKCKDLVQ